MTSIAALRPLRVACLSFTLAGTAAPAIAGRS